MDLRNPSSLGGFLNINYGWSAAFHGGIDRVLGPRKVGVLVLPYLTPGPDYRVCGSSAD
jgi:hypothetical protein